MKDVFRRLGLSVPRGHLIQAADDALSFGADAGFPLVAKPDVGVGANNTWCIRTPLELENFLKEPRQDYMLEEFIPGVIQTFDGLSDAQAKPIFCGSLQYTGVMDMVADKQDTFYFTQRWIPDDILLAGTALLEAFDVRMRFFHFEFFRTPDGRLVALEVNMRPTGGITIDMFNFASDIDLYRLWAEVISGRSPQCEYSRPFHCCYVGRKSYKPYRHSHEQILNRCGERLAVHQPMDPVFHTAMGDYAYIVRSPDLDEILVLAAFIHARN
jgi:biotin carboxylase